MTTMSHQPTPWHCTLDWLAKTAVILAATVGCIYISAFAFGVPNLDHDRQYRKQHQQPQHRYDCRRDDSMRTGHAMQEL